MSLGLKSTEPFASGLQYQLQSSAVNMSARGAVASLTSLPPEILQQILAEIVPTNCMIKFVTHLARDRTNSYPDGSITSQAKPSDECVIPDSEAADEEPQSESRFADILSLLLLPGPIHSIALNLIYTTNTFHFPTPATCYAFSKRIHPRNRSLIRNICICAGGSPIPRRSCVSSLYDFELPLAVPDIALAIAPFDGLRQLKLEGVGPGDQRHETWVSQTGRQHSGWYENCDCWQLDCIQTVAVVVGAIGLDEVSSRHEEDSNQSLTEHEGTQTSESEYQIPNTGPINLPPALKNARVIVTLPWHKEGYKRDRNVFRMRGTKFIAHDVDFELGGEREVVDIHAALKEAESHEHEVRTRAAAVAAVVEARPVAAEPASAPDPAHDRLRARFQKRREDSVTRVRSQRFAIEREKTRNKRDYWIEELPFYYW